MSSPASVYKGTTNPSASASFFCLVSKVRKCFVFKCKSLLESHSISVVISRLGEKKAIIPHFVDESMLLSDPSGPNTRAKVSEWLGLS